MQKLEILAKLVQLAYGEGKWFKIDYSPAAGAAERAWRFEGPNDGPHFAAGSIEELVDRAITKLVKEIEAGFSRSASRQAVYEQFRRELPRLGIPALEDVLTKPVGAP